MKLILSADSQILFSIKWSAPSVHLNVIWCRSVVSCDKHMWEANSKQVHDQVVL